MMKQWRCENIAVRETAYWLQATVPLKWCRPVTEMKLQPKAADQMVLNLTYLIRSMKRARDIRDQLEALLDRVEIEIVSNPGETDKIRLVILSAS